MWPYRSLLFVPGNKPDWARKAQRWTPDAVILDLEDSVPPELKAEAGTTVAGSAAFLLSAGIGAFVRINGLESGGLADVEKAATSGVVAVILPKADSASQIRDLDRALSYEEGRAGLPHGEIAIVPLPETAAGLQGAMQLAAASSRVKGICGAVLGGGIGGDTAFAAGFRPTDEGLEQLYVSSKIALESRAAGSPYPVAAISGMGVDDLETVRTLVTRARSYGYTGCAVIHPSHVAVIHDVFTPSREELDYCEALIGAMEEAEKSGSTAIRYRGMMVDYAMIGRAREVIDEANRRKVQQS